MKAPLSKSVLVRLASAAMRSDQFRLIRYAFAGVVV
jgi:hypothetical protein